MLGEARPTRNAGLLAEALRMTFSNDFAGAAKKYEQLANSSSRADKAQALVDLGRSLERNNRSEEALSRYQEAIALNAAYPAAVMRSGILLDRLKRSGDSEQAFRRAEELYQALSNTEGQAEVWFQRGRLAFGHRRTGEAMDALNRSLLWRGRRGASTRRSRRCCR